MPQDSCNQQPMDSRRLKTCAAKPGNKHIYKRKQGGARVLLTPLTVLDVWHETPSGTLETKDVNAIKSMQAGST